MPAFSQDEHNKLKSIVGDIDNLIGTLLKEIEKTKHR